MRMSDWISDVCSSDLLHTELARYGMVLRPRGNGLTIANANGKGMIKASALHRNFSMAAVQGRLGPFQTAQQVQAAGRQQPTRSGAAPAPLPRPADRKSTRLNSSH